MGKLHKLQRARGEITVRVLNRGKIINGKYYPAGWVEVVEGINGEQYRLDPKTAMSNYEVDEDSDFYRELLEANGGKL